MPHPFFQGLAPTLHISHRGGAKLAPENTLLAFRIAVERHQTDMLELDVHRTRDGVWVVTHDPKLDRCTDLRGPVSEFTFAEVRQADAGYWFSLDSGQTYPFRGRGARIPSLSETFRAFPKMRFNIDLKEQRDGATGSFAELVRAEGAAARICCGSEEDAQADELVQALPECCRFYPRQALTEFVLAVRSGDEPALDARFSVLDMPLEFQGVRLIDAALLDAARKHDRWINVWTVDDPTEMRRLASEGIGGIMTDRPDLLRQVLSELKRP